MPRPVLRQNRTGRKRGLADGLVLFGLAGLFGLGATTLRRYERTAERDIAARLQGDGKKVRLRMTYGGILSPALGEVAKAEVTASHFSVQGLPFLREPWRSSKGKLDRLIVDLRDFELTGLPVARLRASIPDVRFDMGHASKHGQIRIARAGTGTAEVSLRPQEIAQWLMRRSPALRGVTAHIEDGQFRVLGRIRFAGFEIPFDVLSHLTGDGPRLSIQKPRILLGGVLAEGPQLDDLVRKLNPVVDADRDLGLRGAVGIQRVTMRAGLVIATGTVVLPEAQRGASVSEQ